MSIKILSFDKIIKDYKRIINILKDFLETKDSLEKLYKVKKEINETKNFEDLKYFAIRELETMARPLIIINKTINKEIPFEFLKKKNLDSIFISKKSILEEIDKEIGLKREQIFIFYKIFKDEISNIEQYISII